jgi:hypothetical protein
LLERTLWLSFEGVNSLSEEKVSQGWYLSTFYCVQAVNRRTFRKIRCFSQLL